MNDDFLSRLREISADVLPGDVRQARAGENYYLFETVDGQGAKTTLPPVWLNPEATDRQIHEKLVRALQMSLHPESSADDLSVPTLRTEGRR